MFNCILANTKKKCRKLELFVIELCYLNSSLGLGFEFQKYLMPEEKLTRIAIIASDKCKPKKCRQECKKSCPVVRMGKLCLIVEPTSKIAFLSEELCIGCGICVKKCPFEAIMVINLPTNLDGEQVHRYSANSFKLHRLPSPRVGQVLGLVGTNGIGKSSALKILAGKLKPNLGRFEVCLIGQIIVFSHLSLFIT